MRIVYFKKWCYLKHVLQLAGAPIEMNNLNCALFWFRSVGMLLNCHLETSQLVKMNRFTIDSTANLATISREFERSIATFQTDLV